MKFIQLTNQTVTAVFDNNHDMIKIVEKIPKGNQITEVIITYDDMYFRGQVIEADGSIWTADLEWKRVYPNSNTGTKQTYSETK